MVPTLRESPIPVKILRPLGLSFMTILNNQKKEGKK
jgi:hypothetical protein